MKNKSIIFLFLLFMSMAHAQDTVSESDPWYLFESHVPLQGEGIAYSPTHNIAVNNIIKQC